MINSVAEVIKTNYEPLIPEHMLNGLSQIKLPKPFEALFTKEHSLKYAVMESLFDLSPMGEYLIPTENGQRRYIDIYCSDGKNKHGFEVKVSPGELSNGQMSNYLRSMDLDFIYLVYPVIYETEDSHLKLYYEAKGGYKDINKYAFAKAAFDSFGTKGRIGKNLNINEEIKIKRTSYLNETRDNLRPASFDFMRNGLNVGIGIIAINPFGGVQILSEPKFKLNVVQNNYVRPEKGVYGNFSKPEEEIKFAIWKYFRKRKSLIVAEAPLESSSKVSESWFGPNGDALDMDEGYKKTYEYLGGSFKEIFKEKVGYKKTIREGKYIIDFVVLETDDEQNGNELIGIECKESANDIDLSQLKSYYESYELDRLYVAVGESDSNKLSIFFQTKLYDHENWVNKIGIILVARNKEIIIKKKADKLKPFNIKWFVVTKKSPKNPYHFKEIPSIVKGQ